MAAVMLALLLQDAEEVAIRIPVRGDGAERAIAALPEVARVAVRDGVAEIHLRRGRALKLSHVRKAVEVGASLGLDDVYVLLARSDEEAAKIIAALQKVQRSLKPVSSLLIGRNGREIFVALEVSGPKLPTLEDVRSAAGIEELDAWLAPSTGGRRYVCPNHRSSASVTPGKCADCGEPLSPANASGAMRQG
jgi:hypothetical protein